jgi:hypothetical protein
LRPHHGRPFFKQRNDHGSIITHRKVSRGTPVHNHRPPGSNRLSPSSSTGRAISPGGPVPSRASCWSRCSAGTAVAGRARVWLAPAPTGDDPDLKIILAYCYVPDEDLLYAALAKMAVLVLPEQATLDDAVSSLVASSGDSYGEARIEEMATASGPCVRVRQLLLDPETGGESGVTSSAAYLWPTQQNGVFLALACTFASPVEGLHEQALDEFAATLTKGAQV